jgi:starch-binding outer membrane protein, SusD/RagB family
MNMKHRHSESLIFALLLVIFTTCGCKKIFDVAPQNALEKEQTYRNVFDADAAVIGLYGKFQGLIKQYVLLNELRGDLMDVTGNADEYLKQLNTHNVSIDNPYVNPQPFYEVILNCNDIMKNFDIMLQDKKMKVDEYNQRYSDVASLRTWVYLQLGIHYGKVPYITLPLENENDIHNIDQLPRMELDQLLTELISTMEQLPFVAPYPSGSSLLTFVDGLSTQHFFIHKQCLLGDLYLWKGEYQKAATMYKNVMETASYNGSSGETYYQLYRIWYSDVVNNNDLAVGYLRFREMDKFTLIDNNNQGWRSMFARGQDNLYNWEWIWILHYDKGFKPTYPLVDLFSNVGGSYLVKPSQAAIDYWDDQVQNNNFPFDARSQLTWRNVLGQPVIMKYLYNYIDPRTGTPLLSLQEKTGKWFLYRAATLHLHYAEAANRDNQHKVAYAITNQGINLTYDTAPGVVNRDVTNLQRTLQPFPYDFDARSSNTFPFFRDPWYRHAGIRGRAYLRSVPIDSAQYFDMSVPGRDKPITNRPALINAMEDMIIKEDALELAYEGDRWPDLVRIARRRHDPAFLADKIYNKLEKAGNPAAASVKAKLMQETNWYLPFKMK